MIFHVDNAHSHRFRELTYLKKNRGCEPFYECVNMNILIFLRKGAYIKITYEYLQQVLINTGSTWYSFFIQPKNTCVECTMRIKLYESL